MTTTSWEYSCGTSGTVTVPVGAQLVHVRCESQDSSGSLSVFGGATVPVPGGAGAGQAKTFEVALQETVAVAVAGSNQVVFTNTVSYFVSWVRRSYADQVKAT